MRFFLGRSLIVGGVAANNVDVGPEILDLGTDAANAAGRLPLDPSQLVIRRESIAVPVNGTDVLLGGRTPDGVVLSGSERFVP